MGRNVRKNMTKKLVAIEMLETRTIHSKQRERGAVLEIGKDISQSNASFLIARKEAKPAKEPSKKAPAVAKPAPAPQKPVEPSE